MTYFLSRLPLSALTLVLVATLCFALTKIAGEEAAFGEKEPPAEVRAAIEKEWGLDRPLHEQYFLHMSRLLVFDSMPSRIQRGQTIRDVLGSQLPTSIRLGVRALILAVLFGIPVGVVAAVHHNRLLDNTSTVLALFGVSVPSFIIASLLVYLLTSQWELFGVRLTPMQAINWQQPVESFMWGGDKYYLIPPNVTGVPRAILEELFRFRLWIPSLALAAFPFAAILRLTRSAMLDALSQDYVRTARAKGVSTWKVVGIHALRNALTPVVTFMGPVTAAVLTGSLVVEKIFALPGIGTFFITSVNNRDLPIIMGLVVFYSALLIAMNLLVDALYPLLNPRLRK